MASAVKVMSLVKRFMEERQLNFMPEGEQALRGIISTDNAQWAWLLRLFGTDHGIVSFHACGPVKVPAPRRAAVAEYLMRANWGLGFGNFEMDWSDGEVSFRTSIPVNASGVSATALSHLVYAPCALMERYLPGLLAVALGNADPEKAAAEAEMETTPSHALVGPPTGAMPENQIEVEPTRVSRLFGNDN